MQVKLDVNRGLVVELAAIRRRAMDEAAAPTLAEAVALAPTEPDPRHGVHLRETAYKTLKAAGVDGLDRVELGFTAFWAVWQSEHLDWDHPHGGEAQFLEKALIRGYEAWLERTAALMRGGMGQ